MKHLFSFVATLCIIILASFVLSPSYAGIGVKKPDQSLVKSYDFTKQNSVNTQLLAVNLYPADITERISLPDPIIRDYNRKVKNDKGMELENRIFNSKNRQDLNPPSKI